MRDSKFQMLRFSEVAGSVPKAPGIYEIHTVSGLALKVGISGDVRTRLIRHGQSRQWGLTFRNGATALEPCDVDSKRSILAKHLYFDHSVDPRYDLCTELGRQCFLEEQCRIRVEIWGLAFRYALVQCVRKPGELLGATRQAYGHCQ